MSFSFNFNGGISFGHMQHNFCTAKVNIYLNSTAVGMCNSAQKPITVYIVIFE